MTVIDERAIFKSNHHQYCVNISTIGCLYRETNHCSGLIGRCGFAECDILVDFHGFTVFQVLVLLQIALQNV